VARLSVAPVTRGLGQCGMSDPRNGSELIKSPFLRAVWIGFLWLSFGSFAIQVIAWLLESISKWLH
jgi:hypothetical protein